MEESVDKILSSIFLYKSKIDRASKLEAAIYANMECREFLKRSPNREDLLKLYTEHSISTMQHSLCIHELGTPPSEITSYPSPLPFVQPGRICEFIKVLNKKNALMPYSLCHNLETGNAILQVCEAIEKRYRELTPPGRSAVIAEFGITKDGDSISVTRLGENLFQITSAYWCFAVSEYYYKGTISLAKLVPPEKRPPVPYEIISKMMEAN